MDKFYNFVFTKQASSASLSQAWSLSEGIVIGSGTPPKQIKFSPMHGGQGSPGPALVRLFFHYIFTNTNKKKYIEYWFIFTGFTNMFTTTWSCNLKL